MSGSPGAQGGLDGGLDGLGSSSVSVFQDSGCPWGLGQLSPFPIPLLVPPYFPHPFCQRRKNLFTKFSVVALERMGQDGEGEGSLTNENTTETTLLGHLLCPSK